MPTDNLQKLSPTIQPSGPGTQKEAGWRGNKMVKVGFSSMQGLRSEMEDAHNIALNCDKSFQEQCFLPLMMVVEGKKLVYLSKKKCYQVSKQQNNMLRVYMMKQLFPELFKSITKSTRYTKTEITYPDLLRIWYLS